MTRENVELLIANTQQALGKDAKSIYAKLLREQGMTLDAIGDILGLHHSTVVYHIKQYYNLIDTDRDYADKYRLAKAELCKIKAGYDKMSRIGDVVNRLAQDAISEIASGDSDELITTIEGYTITINWTRNGS